jgi:hypothetical protein
MLIPIEKYNIINYLNNYGNDVFDAVDYDAININKINTILLNILSELQNKKDKEDKLKEQKKMTIINIPSDNFIYVIYNLIGLINKLLNIYEKIYNLKIDYLNYITTINNKINSDLFKFINDFNIKSIKIKQIYSPIKILKLEKDFIDLINYLKKDDLYDIAQKLLQLSDKLENDIKNISKLDNFLFDIDKLKKIISDNNIQNGGNIKYYIIYNLHNVLDKYL